MTLGPYYQAILEVYPNFTRDSTLIPLEVLCTPLNTITLLYVFMKKLYICFSCYSRISRSNQQLRKSSFVSLGNLTQQQHGSEEQSREEVAANNAITRLKKPHQKKRQPFAQQYQEQRKPVGVDKVLETLFSTTRNHDDDDRVRRYSRTPKLKEQTLEHNAKNRIINQRLLELHTRLRRGTSRLDYIWASCLQLLGERRWTLEDASNPSEMERVSFFVFRDILLAICSRQLVWVHDTEVTPAIVIKTYRKHGVMKYWWHQVVWTHIGEAIRLRQDIAADTEIQQEKKPTVSSVLNNLLRVWSIFIERYKHPSKAIILEGDVQKVEKNMDRSPRNAVDQLFQILPELPNNQHASLMAAGAIATFDLLRKEGLTCSPVLGDFLKKIHERGVLDVPATIVSLSGIGVPSEAIEKYLREGKRLPLDHDKQSSLTKGSSGGHESSNGRDWSKRALEIRVEEIEKALNTSNAKYAIKLWEGYLNYLQTNHNNDEKTTDRILTRFLHLFWGIARSDRAIDVWNHLVKSGRSPEQIHWLAMLNGCVRAEDGTSLQEIWTSMSRSTTEPDTRMWTTYIYGLIKSHKWKDGLQALESLGRIWKRPPVAGSPNFSIEQSDDILTPTLAPVRAALSALIEIRKPDLTPTVIAWAEAQSLQLDTYTFNILLKSLVNDGTQAQIRAHLAQMANHKCAPDVVTFTTILKGLVSNKDSHFHTQPSEVQESTIASVLESMEESGIPPNAQTYSTLVNGLIGMENTPQKTAGIDMRNVPAARAILSYMQKKNMVPSGHLYTILVQYYFACSPPDLPAINSLWASIRHSKQTANLGPFYFDRMIEGYADLDEIEKALQFLRLMPKEGKSPSWSALYKMLAALDRAGEWDLCGEFIRDVEDTSEGLLKHGQGDQYRKNDFFWLVDHLKGKGVMTGLGGVEQI